MSEPGADRVRARPGTYYVFAAARYNNQPFLWDLRVDLKPGANGLMLEQRNSTPVN